MIYIQNLIKTLQDRKLFEIDSLSINENDKIALIGENGTGDSDIMMTDTINPLKSKFKASTKLLNKTI